MKAFLMLLALTCSVTAYGATPKKPVAKKTSAKTAGANKTVQTKAPVPVVEKAVVAPAPAPVPAQLSSKEKYEVCQDALDQLFGSGIGKCSNSIAIRMKSGDQNFVPVDDSPMYGEPTLKEDAEKITLTRKEAGRYVKVELEHDGQGRLSTVRCGFHGGDASLIDLKGPDSKKLDFMYEPDAGKCALVDDSAAGIKVSSPAQSHSSTTNN